MEFGWVRVRVRVRDQGSGIHDLSYTLYTPGWAKRETLMQACRPLLDRDQGYLQLHRPLRHRETTSVFACGKRHASVRTTSPPTCSKQMRYAAWTIKTIPLRHTQKLIYCHPNGLERLGVASSSRVARRPLAAAAESLSSALSSYPHCRVRVFS